MHLFSIYIYIKNIILNSHLNIQTGEKDMHEDCKLHLKQDGIRMEIMPHEHQSCL